MLEWTLRPQLSAFVRVPSPTIESTMRMFTPRPLFSHAQPGLQLILNTLRDRPVPYTLISVRSWAMIFWLGLVSPRYPKMTIRSGGAHCKSSPHGQRRKLPRIFVELLLAIYPPTSRGRQRKLRSRQLYLFHHRLQQDRCHRGLALRRASRFHDDRRAMLRPLILSLRRGPM